MSYPGKGSLYREGRPRHEHREPGQYSDDGDDDDDSREYDRAGLRTLVGGKLSPNYSGSISTENEHYETGSSHGSRRRPQAEIPSSTRPRPSFSQESNQRSGPTKVPSPAVHNQIDVSEAFTKIETNDFGTLYRLVNRYPQVLREDEKSLQAQAMDALLQGDRNRADRCMHRALLVLTCKKERLNDVQAIQFVGELARKGEDHNQFMARYDQAKAGLYSKAREISSSRPQPMGATYATVPGPTAQSVTGPFAAMNLRSMPSDKGHSYARHASSQAQAESSRTRTSPKGNVSQLSHQQQRSDPRIETRGPDDSRIQLNARGLPSKAGQKVQITAGNTGSLSGDYKVRKNPERFFTFGKVFKVLWHQPAGADIDGRVNQPSQRTTGAFNEPIYSSLRWMMVVASKNGYCICCPITTYSGKGLKYKKLHETEIKAHAIVYASSSRPYALQDEPAMTKEPIKINMLGGDELNPASRVHFGKYHTVEYNVKVMELGQVDPDYETRVASYFVRELQANATG